MTDEQRQSVINKIKTEADNHKIVSVWKYVRNETEFTSASKSLVASIAQEIRMDTKYDYDFANGMHNIFKNAAYKKPKLSDRCPYLDWAIKGLISAVITTGLGLLVALPKFQQDNRWNKQQDTSIHRLNQRVDSLASLKNHAR